MFFVTNTITCFTPEHRQICIGCIVSFNADGAQCLIWTNFGPNKCEMLLFKIVFYAQLDASTDKLLTYDVLCTPKSTVMHACINIIFSQPGVKSHHPLGIKTPNEGYFLGWVT